MRSKILLVGVALATLCTSANAAVITRKFDINASAFSLSSGPGSPPPISPLHLNVTLSFDSAMTFGGTTSGLTVNSFNLPYALQIAYDSSFDLLTLATFAGVDSCGNPPSSFCAFIGSATSAAPNLFFLQQSTPSGGYWIAGEKSLTLQAVPEPAAWALMIAGFGLVGGAMRRRARVSVSYA